MQTLRAIVSDSAQASSHHLRATPPPFPALHALHTLTPPPPTPPTTTAAPQHVSCHPPERTLTHTHTSTRIPAWCLQQYRNVRGQFRNDDGKVTTSRKLMYKFGRESMDPYERMEEDRKNEVSLEALSRNPLWKRNELIPFDYVRVVWDRQAGVHEVMSKAEAIRMCKQKDLDLILVRDPNILHNSKAASLAEERWDTYQYPVCRAQVWEDFLASRLYMKRKRRLEAAKNQRRKEVLFNTEQRILLHRTMKEPRLRQEINNIVGAARRGRKVQVVLDGMDGSPGNISSQKSLLNMLHETLVEKHSLKVTAQSSDDAVRKVLVVVDDAVRKKLLDTEFSQIEALNVQHTKNAKIQQESDYVRRSLTKSQAQKKKDKERQETEKLLRESGL